MTTTTPPSSLPPVESEAERRADLKTMKTRATGLLVGVALVWVALLLLTDDVGVAGYAIATFEAAMVGALADWFAVTAIFRHPLGLPIPHTAVVASRKDQFGVTLGQFIQENFLTPDVVGPRLAELDVASRAGAWFADPVNADRAAAHAAGMIDRLAESSGDDDVITLIEQQVRRRVEATDAGPLAATGMRLLTTEGHHEQLLDELLALLDGFLVSNQHTMRERFTTESPWWLPEPVDDALFNRLFDGVRNLISDAATPGGPGGLREEIHKGIERFTRSLEDDPGVVLRANEFKMQLLDNPELRRWIAAVWGAIKSQLREQAFDDTSRLRQRMQELIVQGGQRLQDDPATNRAVNDLVERTGRGACEQFSTEISGLVSNTVSSWNTAETADRLELLLGRDLQWIRINGTVVGGLAGFVIHTIARIAG